MEKACSTCKELKPVSFFGKKSASPDGLCGQCKICIKVADAKRYQRTKDLCKTRKETWRAANRDKVKAQKSRWKAANPEKVKQEKRRWLERNPGARAAWRQERDQRVKDRCALLTPEKRKQIRAVYSQARKLTAETGIPHHVDHIIPLNGKFISGLHVPENLRVVPAKTNIKKGAKVNPMVFSLGFCPEDF